MPPVQTKGRVDAARTRLVAHRGWLAAGTLLVAVIVVVIAVLAFRGSSKPLSVDFGRLPEVQSGPPPWNNGAGALQANLPVVHLTALSQEGVAFHIHQHLDLYNNGKHVTVPQGIGIGNSFLTEIHTHGTDGVIHLESPSHRPYTLGQLFGEWAVDLSSRCLGSSCASLHWWVNGVRQEGDPADLVLRPFQEIVIAAGTPPTHVPKSFNFRHL